MNNKNYHRSFFYGMDISANTLTILNAVLTANTEITPHTHNWGQLNFINNGVIEINIDNEYNLIAPWQYAVWIPPGVLHSSFNKKNTDYCSISIPANLCHRLPQKTCILEMSEVTRSIIKDLLYRKITALSDRRGINLSQVIIDELATSSTTFTYLPGTDDKYLRPVLDFLKENPGDNRTLNEWAQKVYTSEKTLSRRFKDKLHMPFREWRSRLRFLHSLPMLKTDMTIEEISWRLGYNNTSSFIVMFSKVSGTTPERYRNRLFMK